MSGYCLIEGCEMEARVDGLCIKHWQKSRDGRKSPASEASDLRPQTPDAELAPGAGSRNPEACSLKPEASSDKPVCRMADCDSPAIGRSLCIRHYGWLKGRDEQRRTAAEAVATPSRHRRAAAGWEHGRKAIAATAESVAGSEPQRHQDTKGSTAEAAEAAEVRTDPAPKPGACGLKPEASAVSSPAAAWSETIAVPLACLEALGLTPAAWDGGTLLVDRNADTAVWIGCGGRHRRVRLTLLEPEARGLRTEA